MIKSNFNGKSKLIVEFLASTYLFIMALINKYIAKSYGLGNFSILIWLLIWIIFLIYDKKTRDFVDEASKVILSYVNAITVQLILYSIGVLAIYLTTPYFRNTFIQDSNLTIGIILFALLSIFTTLRLITFIYLNRKGIYK